MTDFGDLNLKIPLILAISVFMRRNSFSCSAELRMKKSFITSGPRFWPGKAYTRLFSNKD